MAPKRRYDTIKPGKKGFSGLFIVILIAAVIMLIGAVGAVFMVNNTIDTVEASSGVILNIYVSGNDLIVDIIGGERVDELEYLYVEIAGYELSDRDVGRAVEKGKTEINYENLCDKVRGDRLIAIRGLFSDGKTIQIISKELRFS